MTLSMHLLRQLVANHIERLIAFLDATEPDADLEPSLGWPDAEMAKASSINRVMALDLEQQCDDEGDISDSGIGDADGLIEQLTGYRNVSGIGSAGFPSHVE